MSNEIKRSEHLDWCKKRALEYVAVGNLSEAYSSMVSDLQQHSETADHVGIELGMLQMMGGMLKSDHDMRNYINGFN